jgi:peroxiredoxin
MADAVIRRSIGLGDWEWLQSVSRRAAAGAVTATILLAGPQCAGPAATAPDISAGREVAFSGRIIERETGKPVEGAEIVLERLIRSSAPQALPAWAGETTIRADAEGRFRLEFTPEQVAEPRLCIAMRIRHPGFICRKSRKAALADLIRGQARGEEPFFTTIALEPGLEYTGRVVVPGGKPAAGFPYEFENGTSGTSGASPVLMDDYEGQTDDDGRIRQRMPKTRALALYVGPPRIARARFPFAPYQHFWGADQASQPHDVWAPTDLGRIVLSRGIRLPGRLVDAEGQPLAGQTITAYPVRGRDRHSATTETDGSFSFGPLRSANYVIYGEGQGPYGITDVDAPPLLRPVRVVQPVGVYLKEGATPEPLVLREMPTVRVEVRFVDSKGKPARGSATQLWGLLLGDRGRFLRIPARPRGIGPTSEINAPEPEVASGSGSFGWGIQDQPDDEGRIVFRAPQGLRDATIVTPPAEETTAYKHRLDPNGPILPGPPARLGVLEDDRLMTMVEYRAPVVLVSVKTEDGIVPVDLSVIASYRIDRQNYGSRFIRQPDGGYRSQSLMPDHEYEIRVRDRGGAYDPGRIQRVSLPESGSAELSFPLRKRRKPPEVGQSAPAFAVKTIDGRTLGLASLRGKTLLLHFWQPVPGIPDVTSLKAIHDRFGNDERFAMVGLCLSDDSEAATEVIRSARLSWSQALLRDRGHDPIVVDYGALQPHITFLIGPDGKLIAQGLRGAALEKAVVEALAGK